MALEQSIYIPSLVWYQNKNNIIIDIEISDYKNQSLNIKENIFDFKCQKDIKQYEMNFELFSNIKQHYVKYNESNINIILEKEEELEWSQLTKNKNLYKNNIKINWSYWADNEEEEQNNNFNMEEMMRNMGGGGAGGMPNMEEMMRSMGGMGGMPNMEGMMDGGGGEMEDMMRQMSDEEPDEEQCDENCEEHCGEHEKDSENLSSELDEVFSNESAEESAEECAACQT